MKARPTGKTHDEYLATVSPEQRKALEKLRKTIKSIVPKVEECMSYGLPAFCLDGRALVLFGASANHCSFFPGSGSTVATLKDDLKGYDTSKGTIRFSPDKPLPATLVRKVIKTRLAENEAKRAKSK